MVVVISSLIARLWAGRQDKKSLLVIVQIDDSSPRAVTGEKLVHSSHKRYELGHTLIRQISRGNTRIGEDIPVLDSLRKETIFIGF